MAIPDKLGRDLVPALAHSEQHVGTPTVLVLAAAILASDLDPTAELWGKSPQATALARRWRAEDNVEALTSVAFSCWPEIRLGYGLIRVDHPSPLWIAHNFARLRAKYLLEPHKDIERLAFALDALQLEAQHRPAGKYTVFERTLMLFHIGRVVLPREVLFSWQLMGQMGEIGKALKRAERLLKAHSLTVA